MDAQQTQSDAMLDEIIIRGRLAARKIADDLSYGLGAIQPQTHDATAEAELIDATLASIEPVAASELEFSACTDGRLPVKLADGGDVPVREQLVGADMVSAFYVAESLGERFYADPKAPVAERIADVAEFLSENGLLPSTHIACGAAGGFSAITENVVSFGRNPQYIERLKTLLPEDVYDNKLHDEMLKGNEARLKADAYAGLTPDIFVAAVKAVSGDHAVAELCDDGRGVHGHVEEAIVRIKVDGQALNPTALAEKTNGRQIFGVSDARMERLARLFSRGAEQDYRIAAMALEDFASSGHATLAKDLPTYVVSIAQ
ncbi:MAG TPA: hypothetical protein VIM53_02640 [Candidatus Saccharimonadales bacterium]